MAFTAFIRVARFNDAVAGLSVRQDGAGDVYEAIGPNTTPYFVGTRAGEANNVFEVVPIVDGVEVRLGPGGGTAPDVILRRNTADTLTIVGTVAFAGINVSDGNGIVVGHTGQVTNEGAPELQVLGTAADDSAMTLGRWSEDAAQPLIHFVKSRNAAIDSNTIVVDDDLLGGIIWLPDDGADFDTQAARFHAEVDDASPAAGDIGVAFVWSQMTGFGGALTETMRLTATGAEAQAMLGINVAPSGSGGPLLHIETAVLNLSPEIILRATNAGGSSGARITLETTDGASGNPEIIFIITGDRTYRIGNNNAVPDQFIITKDGVTDPLMAIDTGAATFETTQIRVIGASARLEAINDSAANVANLVLVDFSLLTDSQERDAVFIVGSFSNITDATREGLLEFRIASSGTPATKMQLQGDDVFILTGSGLVVGHTAQITAGSASEMQVLGTASADSTILIGTWSADANGALLDFVKSRETTIGSLTIVADDDVVGAVRFFPDDGVDFATLAAQFFAEVDDGSPAAGDIGMAFVWQQMPGAAGAIAESMRLAANGDLSILAGGRFLSNGAAEIGIQVTNAALTVGTLGSLVVPVKTDAGAPNDAAMGNVDGAFGYNSNDNTLEIRDGVDTYLSVGVAGIVIQRRTPILASMDGWYHPQQSVSEGYVDETRCIHCGDEMQVGDKVALYANGRVRNDGLHAIYGHDHPELSPYVQQLEKRIRELDGKRQQPTPHTLQDRPNAFQKILTKLTRK